MEVEPPNQIIHSRNRRLNRWSHSNAHPTAACWLFSLGFGSLVHAGVSAGGLHLSPWGICAKGDTNWNIEWIYQSRALVYNYNVGELGWNPRKIRMKEGEMGFTKFHSWNQAPIVVIQPEESRGESQERFFVALFLPQWFPHRPKKDKHSLRYSRNEPLAWGLSECLCFSFQWNAFPRYIIWLYCLAVKETDTSICNGLKRHFLQMSRSIMEFTEKEM